MGFIPFHQLPRLDGLSWPSISFYVFVFAVLLTILILWRRFLSRRALMRRVAELEALSGAVQAIGAARLDLKALCELIAVEAGKVIDNRTFQVGLFDRQFYEILYWTIDDKRQPAPQVFDLSDHDGIVAWVRQSQSPLLVRDFERDMESLPARPRYVSNEPPRSGLFIPMMHGQTTVGIIAAQSADTNRFDEEDERRLMILANQAAAAVVNARLYEKERMRAAHLALVAEIARQVNAVQAVDEIFDQVVLLTNSTFGFQPVNIFGLDSVTGDALLLSSSDDRIKPYSARLPSGLGLVGAAAQSAEVIVCNNTLDDERFVPTLAPHSTEATSATRSEIAIPLVVNDQVLGVLDVQSAEFGSFTDIERGVLETLAAEVASAIHKARQFAWQQGQAWSTTAQLQIVEAINQSQDLEEIIDVVTRLTPMLVGVSFCGILLWNEESQLYRGTTMHSTRGWAGNDFGDVCLRVGDWHALDAVHVGHEALVTSHIPGWLYEAAGAPDTTVEQAALLPLRAAGQSRMLAIMVTDNLREPPGVYDGDGHNLVQRRRELLVNIANQAAQSIEGEQLRNAQQEEAWVNTALLQVAEAVNSLTDLNEILDTIVRLIPLLVGVESAIILIYDQRRQLFVPGPSHGVSGMGRGLLETLEIDMQEFRAMRSQAADRRFPSDTYRALHVPVWLEAVLVSSRAYTFTLNAQGRLVGAMIVGIEDDRNEPLSSRRLNILNGVAQQAATAVVNNQLYAESAERARLQQELNVAQEIQASFLPRGDPQIPGCQVASSWLAARQVSGDFYDFLERPDGSWGIVIADVADKGVPAALFMAISRTIIRTVGFNRRDPADVLMRANEIINSEAQSDLFVTVFYGLWDPARNQLTYACAGHNPPLLLRADGRSELLKVPGIALGVIPDISLASQAIRLRRGDTIIFYTDGVTEAMNEDYDEYGMERLYWTSKAAQNLEPAAIVEAITQGVSDHTGDSLQFDDITLIVFKRDRK